MSNICVIGPRSSGKTTYLASLAYWTDQKRTGASNSFNVQPLNEDAKELAYKAENIICEGASLAPTKVEEQGIDALPYYSFKLEMNRRWQKPYEINLAVRDYPGEIFEELESGASNSLHEEFINECLMRDVTGCLILLTNWTKGTDKSYKRVLERFAELMDSHDRTKDFRIAVAMSKCERGELWPARLEPETDLFDVHLPKTKATLQSRIPENNLQFFAISTFGVLRRNDPRPNRIDETATDGKHSVLRNASYWKPYNTIAPLYWLSSGKRMKSDA